MNPPPKLFPNGPEWEEYSNDVGPEYIVTVWGIDYSLAPCVSGQCHAIVAGGLEAGDVLPSVDEALTWLRARIIAHRDELVRVTT